MDPDLSKNLPDIVAVLIPIVGSVVLFAFLSVVGWAKEKRREREAFYRYEVQKKVAEQGGGASLLELMRSEAEANVRRRREGQILGGLITTVIGASGIVVLYALVPVSGVWTAGLIPLSVGLVILVFALSTSRRLDRPTGGAGNEGLIK
jgi:hypothetical protein